MRANSDNKLENFIINMKADHNTKPAKPSWEPLKPKALPAGVEERMKQFRAIPSLYE